MVSHSNITDNTVGASGGGIANFGTLTIRDCAVSGNAATGVNTEGGGIANYAALTIRDSTLLGNTGPLGNDLYDAGKVSSSGNSIGDRYDV
jgi:hypothetical protein